MHGLDPVARRALNWSLGVSAILLVLKVVAAVWTESLAITADAAESTVHLLGTAIAAWSLRYAARPADADHRYGHGKIAFFAAGLEGLIVSGTAVAILGAGVWGLLTHQAPAEPVWGVAATVVTLGIIGTTGVLLYRTGQQTGSIIVLNNARHLLADAVTSLGVLIALMLVWLTGWGGWDPLMALVAGAIILWTGARMVTESFHGLMDRAQPEIESRLDEKLSRLCTERQITYHALQHRRLGDAVSVEVHLQFPDEMSIRRAHQLATEIEVAIRAELPALSRVATHLEPQREHDVAHPPQA